MFRTRLAPMFPALLVLSACGTVRDAAWPEARPLGESTKSFNASVAEHQADPETDVDWDISALSLQDALSRTFLLNPELQIFAWEVRAKEAQTLQASLWPNPEIGGDIEEFGGTEDRSGTQAAELGLGLSQLLPLGGDVKARHRVAAFQRDLSGWDYEAVRLDVFTATVQAFTAVLAAQERLDLADSLLALARQFEQTVSDRADAGKVSPLEATRAGVLRANAEIEQERATQSLAADRRILSSLWGSSDPDFKSAVGDFTSIAAVPSLSLVDDLIAQNPDVARWATETALRQSELDVARAESIPDPTVGFGVIRFNETGETALRAGVSIPLPLFDRNQGAIQQAKYRLQQAEAGRRAAQMAVWGRLVPSYQTLTSAYVAVTRLSGEVLPAAREIFSATEEGYREGKFDLLTVLDAQRTLFEAANRYVDELENFHRGRAEVERLIGTPLSKIDIQ